MPFQNIFTPPLRKRKEENKKIEKKPKIIIDIKEKNSLVGSELIYLGIEIEWRNLPVGDYIVKEVVIERKTISDFISSMINKRLVRQLEELQQYEKKLVIIEGIEEQELYNDSSGGIHGNAIRGFLLHVLLEQKIPIIFTKDYQDTAKFLYVLARKTPKNHISIRATKKSLNKKEQMQFILEGFPGIGPATAKKLLKKYRTIKSIINEEINELKKEIGKKAEIFKILEEGY